MSFTLYNYVLSGNCYKIRLLASLLNADYESVAVDFHPGQEHKSDTLLALNPAGTLPILVNRAEVFTESQAMLVWLAQQYDTTNTWWPADNQAQVLQWLAFSSRLSGTIGELRLHSMLHKVIDVDSTHIASIATLRELESHLTEQRLRGHTWLTGKQVNIADIACFPYVALSPDAGIEHDDYPAIRRWIHAIRSLERFITMPGIHELHESKPAGKVCSAASPGT